ncbi:MAG: hypothetical protein ACFCU4_08815 [Puniceicoccaceae bacterium]
MAFLKYTPVSLLLALGLASSLDATQTQFQFGPRSDYVTAYERFNDTSGAPMLWGLKRYFSGSVPLTPLGAVPEVYGGYEFYNLEGKDSAFIDYNETVMPTTGIVNDGFGDLRFDTIAVKAGHVAPDATSNGGPWINHNPLFPDMAGLARTIKQAGARPGIWMRPLLTTEDVPEAWKIRRPPAARDAGFGHQLDPSHPGVIERIANDITRLRDWGYEMIKHDFSTYDITGRWGFEMLANGLGFCEEGWTFFDPSRTTGEIIRDLYQAIRDAAGPDVCLIGCNTVSHLAAGLVEIQRIGDDTSASDWDRTRRMGVNTLAFRSVQQGTFYAADADCVPVTPQIPEALTRQWLDLIARSGTPLFLSIDPSACGPEMREAIRHALAQAVRPADPAEALDWMDTTTPAHWSFQDKEVATYHWSEYDTDQARGRAV